MEEKIIEAKFTRNIFTTVLMIISLALIVLGLILAVNEYNTGMVWDFWEEWVPKSVYYSSFFSYLVAVSVFEDAIGASITFYSGVLFFIVTLILVAAMNKCSLVVTNKRVTGKASFGKQVDLPINQISAISLGSSNSIGIATSSGKISFWCLKNRTEVYNAISNLLATTQTTQTNNTTTNVDSTSNADELVKYKQLLDSGIITQEEFDAKKKQLLGL